jgi:23S rRNA (guanine745-N1)-methyltransferase
VLCKNSLERENKRYICPKGHSFDISKEGYVNLLPSDRARSNSGDNAQMMAARNRFLNKGYYSCLKDALSQLAFTIFSEEKSNEVPLLVDAGCGEGYYTTSAASFLREKGISANIAGIDLSKRGVKAAVKRDQTIEFAVAGIFDLPFESGSSDLVFSIFAPICESEFRRILKVGGALAVVTPGKEHLMGLKKVLYDNPYENPEEVFCPQGFEPLEAIKVKQNITVCGSDIGDLFMMTPYFWNTPAVAAERLQNIDILDTPVEFIITVLKKHD